MVSFLVTDLSNLEAQIHQYRTLVYEISVNCSERNKFGTALWTVGLKEIEVEFEVAENKFLQVCDRT